MPELRVHVSDPKSDLEGFVVVDSLVGGRAMGGTRMTSTVSLEEVAGLAKKMTLKLALADLPMGGAKAGIVCGLPPGPERDRRLAAFGRAVEPLLHGGIYLGTDQGVTHRDREIMFTHANFDISMRSGVQLPCGWTDLWRRTFDVTGYGVCEAIDTSVEALGIRTECATVAVQGFGAVGRGVAIGLERRGFSVVAVADRDGTVASPTGLPLKALLDATDAFGTIDRTQLPGGLRVDPAPEAWLDVDADVLVLAAGGDAVNEMNVGRVRARVVAEGGNLACSREATHHLAGVGVYVLPDIVVNVGGATVTGLVLTGLAPEGADVDELVQWFYDQISDRIRRNMVTIIERAASNPRPLCDLAEDLAAERLSALGSEAGPVELEVAGAS